jgi:hypothetical protein
VLSYDTAFHQFVWFPFILHLCICPHTEHLYKRHFSERLCREAKGIRQDNRGFYRCFVAENEHEKTAILNTKIAVSFLQSQAGFLYHLDLICLVSIIWSSWCVSIPSGFPLLFRPCQKLQRACPVHKFQSQAGFLCYLDCYLHSIALQADLDKHFRESIITACF